MHNKLVINELAVQPYNLKSCCIAHTPCTVNGVLKHFSY